jgi:hypothetical protein
MNFFADTDLKPTTYKTYNTQLHTWLSLFPSEQANLLFLYTHPNYSIVTLRKHLSTKNQNNPRMVNSYIKPIVAVIRENPQICIDVDKNTLNTIDARWKELRQITYDLAFAYRIEQKPSPGQAIKSGSTLTLDDLIKIRDELPDGSINKLLIGFYTYLPPVRADYFATQLLPFGHTPTSSNYIFYDYTHSHSVITDFKTSSLYKQIANDLPAELHRQLILSLQHFPRKYLFVNKNGEPITRNGFTKWAVERLFQIFNKGLTLTMLRHIYISSLDFNIVATELQAIGLKMGHQLSQQMLYKWKTNPPGSNMDESS